MYFECLCEGVSSDDVVKALWTLAKYSKGVWKSEAQGKFLQSMVGKGTPAYPGVQSWMKSEGLEGTPFVYVVKLAGYGHQDVSKVRYSAHIFVVDAGGVVFAGTAKVHHPKKDEPGVEVNWGKVDGKFRRTEVPTLLVDLDAAAKAAAKANEPQIQAIQAIPGWEKIDILADFVDRLSAGGKPLTMGQLAVVQKYAPKDQVVVGSGELAGVYQSFRKLLGRLAREKALRVVSSERKRGEEYAAVKAAGGYWPHGVPLDAERLEKELNGAIGEWEGGGTPVEPSWFWRELLQDVEQRAGVKQPVEVAISWAALQELVKIAEKGLKGKKLTKSGAAAFQYMKVATQKL